MTSSRQLEIFNRANFLAASYAAAVPVAVFIVMAVLDATGAENAAGLVFALWWVVALPGALLAPLHGWITMVVIVSAWAIGGLLASHVRSVGRRAA